MMMRILSRLPSLLLLVQPYAVFSSDHDGNSWTWEKIFDLKKDEERIVANGNIFPSDEKNESWDDCLILVTRKQFMVHCPSLDEHDERNNIVIFSESSPSSTQQRHQEYKFRGAVSIPGTEERRMWLLNTTPQNTDYLLELDTITGETLQTLLIPGSRDGHDLVRVSDKIFMVDTFNGHVIEMEIPVSAPPYNNDKSIKKANAKKLRKEGEVNIIKRHTGFTRRDHINNVAVHPSLLISNLHGGQVKPNNRRNQMGSQTRLSALDRSISSAEGRELNMEQDNFQSITNVGTMCHGIAFWSPNSKEKIVKLISLDSKEGTLVSVDLTGPSKFTKREVLWVPDETHPVLIPPPNASQVYKGNGSKIFSKGLAVQGDVAYFGVSYARAPALRANVPESLLVAYNLQENKVMWERVVKSNGLINQIVTRGHLGWEMRLSEEVEQTEIEEVKKKIIPSNHLQITHHHPTDNPPPPIFCENTKRQDCTIFEESPENCLRNKVKATYCCACQGGGVQSTFHSTITFAQDEENKSSCREANTGKTKKISLHNKRSLEKFTDSSSDSDIEDVDRIVKYLCTLNVQPVINKLNEMGNLDEIFHTESQLSSGNAVLVERMADKYIKPGVKSIQFIFSSHHGDVIYHFPLLSEWKMILEEYILNPLGIQMDSIIRMGFANMQNGSTINLHSDRNKWVKKAHRIHIPIITHSDVYFMSHYHQGNTTRIKSEAGQVFEFNNAFGHSVRNLGDSRIHLILDWIERPIELHEGSTERFIQLKPRQKCRKNKKDNLLICDDGDDEEVKDEL